MNETHSDGYGRTYVLFAGSVAATAAFLVAFLTTRGTDSSIVSDAGWILTSLVLVAAVTRWAVGVPADD